MTFPDTTATVHPLDSGLTAILDPDPDSEIISVQFWVETGSMHESALAGSGLSHLLEHMVFKGSKNFSGAELATRVQAAGGQWNAYTSFDRTVYYISGPADSLPVFTSTLAELVFRPSFPEEDYEREKDVIRREIDMGLDDPDSVDSQLLFSTFFRRDHRRHPVIGNRKLFDQVTHDEMVAYHAARYQPANVFVVISGGFNPEEALSSLESEVEKGTPPRREFPVILPAEPQAVTGRRASQPFAVPSTRLSLAWQIPGLDHPDTPALELLSTVLGGGRSTPLYREIREKKNLALHIGASTWSPPEGPGIFSISAEALPEKSGDLEAAILKTIGSIPSHALPEALDRARRQTAVAQLATLHTASGRASDLGSNWHEARNLDLTRDFLAQLAEVTPADLLRVAETYLRPNRLTTTTLVPEVTFSKPASRQKGHTQRELIDHTLSNGLRVILERDPRVPMAYAHAVALAGAPSETAETCGINSLMASLAVKGTKTRDAEEIARLLENRGASLRAASGNNTSQISLSCLGDDLAELLPLFGDIVANPTFPADALGREREALLADLEEAEDDPAARAFIELRRGLWGDQSYGLSPYGKAASLNALTSEKVRAHQQRHFSAKNMVLTLFGDLDPAQVIENLEASMKGVWASRPNEQSQGPPPSSDGSLSIPLDKNQTVIAIAYPGLGADDPRRFALSLLDNYFSDMSGPLFTRIREELGLAYMVGSSIFHGVGTGLLAFYLGTSPGQAALAEKELKKLIQTFAENGIPEAILPDIKASVRAAEALRNQNPSTRAKLCAIDVLLGLSPDHHRSISARTDSLTHAEVFSTARDLLSPAPLQVRVGGV